MIKLLRVDHRLLHGQVAMGAGDSYLAALIVSLLKKGWKKGVVLQADVIKAAMDDAAHYSSDNCLREGGFGFKNQIEE